MTLTVVRVNLRNLIYTIFLHRLSDFDNVFLCEVYIATKYFLRIALTMTSKEKKLRRNIAIEVRTLENTFSKVTIT